MQNEGNGRPLASIIVNNYNYARFLGEAIDSALGQTYAPLEVVVVDDGSTDESREVIARYGDRITAVLKENGGQASALNAGFAASRGDLVLFLDADDALLPTTVERAAELFEQPGLVKVHWPMLEIDAQGQRTGELQPPYPLHQGDLRTRSLREGPVAGDAAPTSGNLWSRDLLERILPMPEQEYRINADGYLVMLAWIYGLVRTIDEPLSLYRVHGDNHHVVQARAKKRQQYLDFFLVHCRDLQRHFAGLGVDTDPNEWRINKDLCTFEERVDAAKRELATILDPGTRYILVDDQAWTPPTAEVLPGRTAVPFLERDGHYWGRPADDAAAIADLIRLREAGAEFIVFPWYARWWLDHYPAFTAKLRALAPCTEGFHVTAFDLRWSERVLRAKARLTDLLPLAARFILVDEGAWFDQPDTPPITGRRAVPFPERDGVYWGKPGDDAEAIAELERLRSDGAQFIAFPWFTSWWLEAYPEFDRHLRATASCIAADDYVTAFDLRT